ncbi:8114_t:CDS:2 [Funneliformis mosseae]|uniref:8114_t:CDS:1 n=1 Tax=Funneliformis mosseae TaxID=27381 RepID=A0A9N9AW92_FUNMO|nr:8114_t:CDS:2 [Funneliformis mosseae]
MNLGDLLGNQRKSEPNVVLMMRLLTLLIIASCFILYIAMLIMDVNNELPMIITSEDPVDSLALPDVVISFDNPFRMYCTFTWIYNEVSQRIENETCMNYVTSPQYIQGEYRGYFSLNDNSTLFTFPKLNEERLDSLSLTVLVDDPNFNASTFDPTPPYVFIFDSENNPIKLSDGTLNLTVLNVSQATNYERKLLFSNRFIMPDRLPFWRDIEYDIVPYY